MEERMLERNAACPGRNVQPRGEGLYGRREGQITWRTEEGYREENILNRGETQIGLRRDPNAMDIDRERGEDRTCYI